jgi:hypothetical protein
VALGLDWRLAPGTQGYLTTGYYVPTTYTSGITGETEYTGSIYQAGTYVPGLPDAAWRGYESDARAVLVPAAVALALASRRRTRATRRAVVVATVAVAVIALRAGAQGQTTGAIAGAIVVGLVASVLWGGPARARRSPTTATPQSLPADAPTTPLGSAF